MPSFITVVEDTSPMLVYSANWQAGTSADSSADQYTESSFMVSQTQGDSMSFKFFGTSIGVFGSKRSNHGSYEASVDGISNPTFNGLSSTSEFNQSLFSTDMTLGSHNVTITNAGSSFLDIDYVTFQTNVGKDDEDLIVNTYQDTHPSFTYTPSSSWATPNMVGTFMGGSGHASSQPSAKAILTFQGDAIALYGPVGPNSTLSYSVQVDNGSPSVLSAQKQFYRSQQMLFYAGNLGAGQHSLQIQLGSTPSAGEFAIDYANVYTAPSLGGSFLAAAPTGDHLPSGTLAALAITSTLAILASLLCMYLFWRQRFVRSQFFEPPQYYGSETADKSKMMLDESTLAQPYNLSPAMERSLGGGHISGRSERSSQLNSPVEPRSVYSSGSPSTLQAEPPVSAGARSEVETRSSSVFSASSAQAYQDPGSVNVSESAEYRRNEKAGLIFSNPGSVSQPGQSSAANSQYTELTVVNHPPPEYSQNPNGTAV